MRHNKGQVMDIFFMILFNLFTGSVIYLVLSLKIERTSSTFQEKRLKREMNEIMTEFNAAAERNISILENRIAVIKKMAGEKGIFKNFDYTVSDEIVENEIKQGNDSAEKSSSSQEGESASEYNNKEITVRNRDTGIIAAFFDKISFIKKDVENAADFNINDNSFNDVSEFSIEKDLSRGSVLDYKVDDDIIPGIAEDDAENIEELFLSSDDKYGLMCELYIKGYSVEELSKFSGIPAGEVKLIISLNT